MKTKAKRNEQVVGIDPSKICPLESMYDADIYDALFIRRYSRDSGGEGNYVHYTSPEFWLNPSAIDTPFGGIQMKIQKEESEYELEEKR